MWTPRGGGGGGGPHGTWRDPTHAAHAQGLSVQWTEDGTKPKTVDRHRTGGHRDDACGETDAGGGSVTAGRTLLELHTVYQFTVGTWIVSMIIYYFY
jgi:hypothetical protein